MPAHHHGGPCAPVRFGEYTQSFEDRPVTIIAAGKPDSATGLLVPLQTCVEQANGFLTVTLVSAQSSAGTPMTGAPPVYMYRSLVFPAPATITARGGYYWLRNVGPDRIDGSSGHLVAPATTGLYLLVFERSRYGDATDPRELLATVTYRVEWFAPY